MNIPYVALESASWVILWKPHGMPTVPLAEGERGTLLEFFISLYPEGDSVCGKKGVERGIIHRLDTATSGLVLAARTQATFDSLWDAQKNGLIRKTYTALCDHTSGSIPVASIQSRFRAYGPKGREVRPLFPGMRGYDKAGAEYETIIEKIEECADGVTVTCSLVRGYRHQIRSHLASAGFPLIGDTLYNPRYREVAPESVTLGLSATALSFPDPDTLTIKSFSLPQPDKTSL
jgi:23S rRNA pseudouridine1911/1915/1917 synthase